MNGYVVIPAFEDDELLDNKRPTDFNDLYILHGANAVKQGLMNVVSPKNALELFSGNEDSTRYDNNTDISDLSKVIDKLAQLSKIEYDRIRIQKSKEFGIRVSTLDSRVAEAHTESVSVDSALFNEIDVPWEEPVDGVSLLDELATMFGKYAILPNGGQYILALWSLHTHLFESFQHTPRLNITAPVKGAGKTLIIDLLETVCYRAMRVESMTTAVFFRLSDQYHCTMLIDEYDTFLKGNDELRGAINAGHKVGGQHPRCEGDSNKVKLYKTFCPVALAGIKALPSTIHDRSIIIKMKKARKGELKFRFDSRYTEEQEFLKRKMVRWANDHRDVVSECLLDVPDALFNRERDNWLPLMAISNVVGGHWPITILNTIAQIQNIEIDSDEIAIRLLTDIRDILHAGNIIKIPSYELVKKLIDIEESPWQHFGRQYKPITPTILSSVHPQTGIFSILQLKNG